MVNHLTKSQGLPLLGDALLVDALIWTEDERLGIGSLDSHFRNVEHLPLLRLGLCADLLVLLDAIRREVALA